MGDNEWLYARQSCLQLKKFPPLADLEPETLDQGPVVQSIVSLTSLLRGQPVKCSTLSVLGLYNQNHWYFLLKKWGKLLHCKSFSHLFNKKYRYIWHIKVWNFNEMLTNDVVSFEQLGPAVQHLPYWATIWNTVAMVAYIHQSIRFSFLDKRGYLMITEDNFSYFSLK